VDLKFDYQYVQSYSPGDTDVDPV